MSEVIAIKTVGNEEVIGIVVSENNDYYVLKTPRALVMQQMQDQTVTIGMLPFMASANNPEMTTEANIILYKKDIMAQVESVPKPMEIAYLKQVSTIHLV